MVSLFRSSESSHKVIVGTVEITDNGESASFSKKKNKKKKKNSHDQEKQKNLVLKRSGPSFPCPTMNLHT